MLSTALTILAAWAITKRLHHWRNWLPISLLAGAVVALAVLLASPSASLGLEALLFNATLCALCAWGFRGFSPPRKPG
jgi:hypothetical protein